MQIKAEGATLFFGYAWSTGSSNVSCRPAFRKAMPGIAKGHIRLTEPTPINPQCLRSSSRGHNQTIEPNCRHCAISMPLVRRIELKDMPAIYIFYCSRCQYAETLKRERTVREPGGRELVEAA
jgi:hypothetical protein